MTPRIKYPKTMHLPWSPGLQNDDRLMPDVDCFVGKEVVVTEKMDGENTTLYNDYIHARSIDGRHHASRDWVKALHGRIKHLIPDGFRICGENLYAQHSIRYEKLPTYFMVFSVWEYDLCLSWDETEYFAKELGLQTVPVVYRGSWEEFGGNSKAGSTYIWYPIEWSPHEGYVVRVADAFSYTDFERSVAKYVRKDHIQTDEHWMTRPVVPNGLKEP